MVLSQSWLLATAMGFLIPLTITTPADAKREYVEPSPLSAADVENIMKSLQSPDNNDKVNALRSINYVQPIEAAQRTLPLIIEITKRIHTDKDDYSFWSVQTQAMVALGKLAKTEESIAILFDNLNSADGNVRLVAAQNVPVEDAYMPQVTHAMANPDPNVRITVVKRFYLALPLTDSAIKLLRSVMQSDEKQYIRDEAAKLITQYAKNG